MLYDEFIQGTGCKDNADNYKVYRDLEILYMNSDLTKEAIYEYGKKLVNNALTASQIAWNAEIDSKIAELTAAAEELKKDVAKCKELYEYYKENYYLDLAEMWKRDMKWTDKRLKDCRRQIRELKSCKYA